ncbi:MoaD-MoaE fusion protein MoaX, partial [Mycobacterium tuberculosis 1010SM]
RTRGCLLRSTPETSRRLRSQIRESPDSPGRFKVTKLYYEAYPAMVHRTLMDIIEECERQADGVRVAVAHRTGELRIGDAAVVIGASAPHRAAAFDAARMCIERLKQDVPIWKKEFALDGVEWVANRP